MATIVNGSLAGRWINESYYRARNGLDPYLYDKPAFELAISPVPLHLDLPTLVKMCNRYGEVRLAYIVTDSKGKRVSVATGATAGATSIHELLKNDNLDEIRNTPEALFLGTAFITIDGGTNGDKSEAVMNHFDSSRCVQWEEGKWEMLDWFDFWELTAWWQKPFLQSHKVDSKMTKITNHSTGPEPPYLDERYYRKQKGLNPDEFKLKPVELVISNNERRPVPIGANPTEGGTFGLPLFSTPSLKEIHRSDRTSDLGTAFITMDAEDAALAKYKLDECMLLEENRVLEESKEKKKEETGQPKRKWSFLSQREGHKYL
ncbi:hypothetical protein ACLMJK_004019 [Lecanora helva]